MPGGLNGRRAPGLPASQLADARVRLADLPINTQRTGTAARPGALGRRLGTR